MTTRGETEGLPIGTMGSPVDDTGDTGERCYCAPFTSVSTTEGSASVVVSPRFLSPLAILVRIRLMILPLLVLGRASANCSLSGLAIGPITFRT